MEERTVIAQLFTVIGDDADHRLGQQPIGVQGGEQFADFLVDVRHVGIIQIEGLTDLGW